MPVRGLGSCSKLARVVVVGALTAGLAATAVPAAAAPDDRLVVSDFGAAGEDVYTVQADGQQRRDLQGLGTTPYNGGPRWTADATSLIALIYRDTRCCDVQVAAQDGSSVRTVATTNGADINPVVSPDATRIGWSEMINVDGHVQLVLAAPDGSNRTTVRLPHTNYHSPAWSPRGDRISYHTAERFPEVYTVALDGTALIEIAQYATGATWSPRGDALLVASYARTGTTHAVVAAADGSGERLAVPGFPAGWSPDGSSIFVTRGRDLLLIDVATGSERLVYSVPDELEPAQIEKVAVSPDGERVALSYAYGDDSGVPAHRDRSPVVMVDTQTGQELGQIGEPTGENTQLAFSPLPTTPRPVQPLAPACADDSAPAGYTDTEASVHRAAIDCLSNKGVLRGTSPTTFHPDRDVTRAQIALMLFRLAEREGVELDTSDAGFTDLDGSSAEARDAVNAMANGDVVNGQSATTFAPGAPASRAQTASLLGRFQQLLAGASFPYRGNCFFDDAGNVHELRIDELCGAGVVSGTDGRGRFAPGASLSRGQVASFLARLLAANAEPEQQSDPG